MCITRIIRQQYIPARFPVTQDGCLTSDHLLLPADYNYMYGTSHMYHKTTVYSTRLLVSQEVSLTSHRILLPVDYNFMYGVFGSPVNMILLRHGTTWEHD
jgi:hypothetical protein